MTDDRAVPERLQRSGESPVQLSDILAVADWFREDIAAAKAELMALIAENRAERRDWEVVHAQQHISEEAERKAWHEKLGDLLHAEEISKARRDGILGAVRFVFDLVGRNWRGILAVTGLAGVLSGTFHIDVGAR